MHVAVTIFNQQLFDMHPQDSENNIPLDRRAFCISAVSLAALGTTACGGGGGGGGGIAAGGFGTVAAAPQDASASSAVAPASATDSAAENTPAPAPSPSTSRKFVHLVIGHRLSAEHWLYAQDPEVVRRRVNHVCRDRRIAHRDDRGLGCVRGDAGEELRAHSVRLHFGP